jgi:lipopolysaccharide biosynthesis protein
MFYMQKLDFLRHRQQRNVSLVLNHLNKSSSSNNATTNHHHPQVEQEQQHQKHEEEEKRLLEGNPLADG